MGAMLMRLPQVASQNIALNDKGQPRLKAGSPVARVKQKGQKVAATVPSPFAKSMSDTQLQHRKRISANTAIVTSTLGLGALGAHGGGAALRHLGKVRKIPKLMATGRKIQRAAVPVSLTSGGISGAAGYNYAGIQRAEAKKKVAKAFVSREPKVRAYQRDYLDIDTKTGQMWPSRDPHDTLAVKRTGNSLIRQRPKYDMTFQMEDRTRHDKKTGMARAESQHRSRLHTTKAGYKSLGQVITNKEKTTDINGHKLKVVRVKKAYSPENNRRGRAKYESAGAVAAGVGAMGGASFYAHRAGGQQTRDVNSGRDILGRSGKELKRARENHLKATQDVSQSRGAYENHRGIQERMRANASVSASDKGKQTRVVNAHLKAMEEAKNNVKAHEVRVSGKAKDVRQAASGLKKLTRIRRITGTKAGALGALGAGGVAGGVYLARIPHTKSGQSYSKRYRPRQS